MIEEMSDNGRRIELSELKTNSEARIALRDVQGAYKKWLPGILGSVSDFFRKSSIFHLLRAEDQRVVRYPQSLSSRVSFVTDKKLERMVKPLLEDDGVTFPEGKVPFGFVHPETRKIYIVANDVPAAVVDKKTSRDKSVGLGRLNEWFRRALLEESIHSMQDLLNINGTLSEFSAANYIREYYRSKKLPPFMFTKQDHDMADIYTMLCLKYGQENVDRVTFGTFHGKELDAVLINLSFRVYGESFRRKHRKNRLLREK